MLGAVVDYTLSIIKNSPRHCQLAFMLGWQRIGGPAMCITFLCITAPFLYRRFIRFCVAFRAAGIEAGHQVFHNNDGQIPGDILADLFPNADYSEEPGFGELPAYEDVGGVVTSQLLAAVGPLVLPHTMNVDLPTVEEEAAPRVFTLATSDIQPMLLREGNYHAFDGMGMGMLQVHDVNGHLILIDVAADVGHQ